MKYKTVLDGEKYEKLAIRILNDDYGKLYQTGIEQYDLMNDKFLVEVKSCKLVRKVKDNGSGNPGYQYGRFYILKKNHDMMMKESESSNRHAFYIFFIESGNQWMHKVIDAGQVTVICNNQNISILKVFGHGI